jgi:hypothetical protein
VINQDASTVRIVPIPPSPYVNGAVPRPAAVRRRQRLTIFLPAALIERLRNAVYWTEQRTMAQIIVEAVEDAVTALERTNGGPFPARLAPLKPGRPRRRRAPARLTPVSQARERS